MVAVPFEENPDRGLIYAVTNSHVIREGGSPVVRLNTKDGLTDVIPATDANWLDHVDGDDLAVCPIGLSQERHQYKYLLPSLFLTPELVNQESIGPGEDTFLVGRFITHEGRQRNLPSVRFGNIAMMPWEPITHPTRGIKQESFLVESRSIGGYSGSPVFVWILPFSHRPGAKGYSGGRGPWLLGVDWCHLANPERVLERDGKTEVPEGWQVNSNTGMMGVIPAWRLAELLDRRELVAQRKEQDEELSKRKAKGGAALDAADRFTRRDFDRAGKKISHRTQREPSRPRPPY